MRSTIGLNRLDVIALEMRDGESITMYRDGMHAKSLTSRRHMSSFYVQRLHNNIKHSIPPGWRISGINLHYMKSIKYNRLLDFFEVHSIWNEYNMSLSWENTLLWTKRLGLQVTPEIWRGEWNSTMVQAIKVNPKYVKGYVIRPRLGFDFNAFSSVVGKYINVSHMQASEHHLNHTILQPNIKLR